MGALGAIMLIGAFGTSLYYWFTQGRNEEFLVGRFKTAFAFCFWYVFVVYLIVNHNRSATRQVQTDEAKKRILG